MKKIRNLIYSANSWYDNLDELKRFLVFLLIVGLPLFITQILLYLYNIWYGFPILTITFLALRLPYLLRPKKTYTFDIETGGLFDNKFLTDFEERGKKQEFYDTKAMLKFIEEKIEPHKTKDK